MIRFMFATLHRITLGRLWLLKIPPYRWLVFAVSGRFMRQMGLLP